MNRHVPEEFLHLKANPYNRMSNQALSIHFPGKLIFGKGTLDKLQDEIINSSSSKVLIVTITPLLPKLQPIMDDLESKGIQVTIDTSIVQEPSFEDFEKLMKTITPINPDIVVGIGGGSVLDVAKLIAAQLENEQTLQDYVGIGLLKGRK